MRKQPGEQETGKNEDKIIREILHHKPYGIEGGIEIEGSDRTGEKSPGEMNPVN
jgi:hypothetical protein